MTPLLLGSFPLFLLSLLLGVLFLSFLCSIVVPCFCCCYVFPSSFDLQSFFIPFILSFVVLRILPMLEAAVFDFAQDLLVAVVPAFRPFLSFIFLARSFWFPCFFLSIFPSFFVHFLFPCVFVLSFHFLSSFLPCFLHFFLPFFFPLSLLLPSFPSLSSAAFQVCPELEFYLDPECCHLLSL